MHSCRVSDQAVIITFYCHSVCCLSVLIFSLFSHLSLWPDCCTHLTSVTSEVSPATSSPQCNNLFSSPLSLTHTHTQTQSMCTRTRAHTHPLKFSLCQCCVLQSSLLPRVWKSSHQADYALSFNLSALFVPVDHTASTKTNPLFVQAFLIYSDQNCTLHHRETPRHS